jgi:hypothetical protein
MARQVVQTSSRTLTSPSIRQSPHRCARPPGGPKTACLGQPEHMRLWTLTSPLRRHPAHRIGRWPGGAKLAWTSSQVVHILVTRSISPPTLHPAQCTGLPPRGPNNGRLPPSHILCFTLTSPATRHPPHRSARLAPAGAKTGCFSPQEEHILFLRSTSPSTLHSAQCTRLPPGGPNDGTLPHPHFLFFTSTSPGTRHPPHRSGFSAPARA